ncbi:FAD/NAD(P)-binding protein [Arenibacterium sp. CAU 1754]
MTTKNAARRIAVIGMGPRGLGALEALEERTQQAGMTLDLDIFDPVEHYGAGPNFDPDQTPLCILNIPIREVALDRPGYAGAQTATFSEWLGPDTDPDAFPARATLGKYLAERFRDLEEHGKALRLSRHSEMVHHIEGAPERWVLVTDRSRHGPYDEVLLTQGQPRTAPDEQLGRWQTHARSCGADLVSAYPADALVRAAKRWAGKSVAVRGMGLSTLDVLRMLTCGLGGVFENGRYHPSGREPARILPFSLDGHAPVPKPATAAVDESFDPLREETRAFEESLATAIAEGPQDTLVRICDALVPPALRILKATGAAADVEAVQTWLAVERDKPGTQETRAPIPALQDGIAMATGRVPPSPAYVIGQLWRKWQNEIRRAFNPARIVPDTIKAVVGFDEGLKRFSYGPPVSSARELIMLNKAGLVDLHAADDPDILLIDAGWRLVEDDDATDVCAMVDAVLPSPALDRITEPLIVKLKADGRIHAIADGFGADTAADGQIIDQTGKVQTGLSLLGRLALGSVIGVDSIHDCLGAASDRWAEGVISRGV